MHGFVQDVCPVDFLVKLLDKVGCCMCDVLCVCDEVRFCSRWVSVMIGVLGKLLSSLLALVAGAVFKSCRF